MTIVAAIDGVAHTFFTCFDDVYSTTEAVRVDGKEVHQRSMIKIPRLPSTSPRPAFLSHTIVDYFCIVTTSSRVCPSLHFRVVPCMEVTPNPWGDGYAHGYILP